MIELENHEAQTECISERLFETPIKLKRLFWIYQVEGLKSPAKAKRTKFVLQALKRIHWLGKGRNASSGD